MGWGMKTAMQKAFGTLMDSWKSKLEAKGLDVKLDGGETVRVGISRHSHPMAAQVVRRAVRSTPGL